MTCAADGTASMDDGAGCTCQRAIATLSTAAVTQWCFRFYKSPRGRPRCKCTSRSCQLQWDRSPLAVIEQCSSTCQGATVMLGHGGRQKPVSQAQRNAETLFETKNVVEIREVSLWTKPAARVCQRRATHRTSSLPLLPSALLHLHGTGPARRDARAAPTLRRSRRARARRSRTRACSCGSASATPTGGGARLPAGRCCRSTLPHAQAARRPAPPPRPATRPATSSQQLPRRSAVAAVSKRPQGPDRRRRQDHRHCAQERDSSQQHPRNPRRHRVARGRRQQRARGGRAGRRQRGGRAQAQRPAWCARRGARRAVRGAARLGWPRPAAPGAPPDAGCS